MGGAQPQRRSIRLEGYDYAQAGAYFVTLCTAGRVERFGMIQDGEMRLNVVGQMVQREWERLPGRFPGLELDAFVIMPNHVHGILILCLEKDPVGAQRCEPKPQPTSDTLRPHHGHTNSMLMDNSGGLVGAQRCEPKPQPTLDTLCPHHGPTKTVATDDSEGRALRDGCKPHRFPESQRPYDEFERHEATDGSGVERGKHAIIDPGSLGAMVRAFKSSTTLRFHNMRDGGPGPLWQRSYYEHIVRGPADLDRIRGYIFYNPLRWELDEENPQL